MYKLNRPQKGFSLIEVLIVTSVLVLLTGGAIAIYIRCLNAWEEGSLEASLQRKASTAMEKMVRGIDGTKGIREAKSVTFPDSSTIQYTSGIDDQQRSFHLSTDEIIYTSASGVESTIAEDVRTAPAGLTFSAAGDLVTINLGMEGRIMDRIIPVNLTTEVTLRN